MDEVKNKKCPVKVGDHFYRNNPKLTLPDMLEVTEVYEIDGSWFFRAKYIYHTIGPVFDRVFSDVIFRDPAWVIVKKNSEDYENKEN